MNQNQLIQLAMLNHPLFKRAQDMANGKTNEELEQIAKNLCEQRGLDFDTMMKQFSEFLTKNK